MKSPFTRKLDEALAANARRTLRIAKQRLARYRKNPCLGRALAYECAAEEAQIAAGRFAAAEKLAEAWK